MPSHITLLPGGNLLKGRLEYIDQINKKVQNQLISDTVVNMKLSIISLKIALFAIDIDIVK